MPLTPVQADFVRRYLSVEQSMADGGAAPMDASPSDRLTPKDLTRQWTSAIDTWRSANEALDAQLNVLRRAILSDSENEEFAEELRTIAEVGLSALTGNHRVKLMSAFLVIGPGDAVSIRKHGEKAISAITAFRAFLDGNERVDACEGNPWDAEVSIRSTLYPPLDRISEVLHGGLAKS